MIRDNKPTIVDDKFAVFIIHKGSTSTGSIRKFLMAILRAFNTQKKENIFPLIGYYGDKALYKQYKKITRQVKELFT